MIKILNPPQYLNLNPFDGPITPYNEFIFIVPQLGEKTRVSVEMCEKVITPASEAVKDEEGKEISPATEESTSYQSRCGFPYESEIKIDTPDFCLALHNEVIAKIKAEYPELELEIFNVNVS